MSTMMLDPRQPNTRQETILPWISIAVLAASAAVAGAALSLPEAIAQTQPTVVEGAAWTGAAAPASSMVAPGSGSTMPPGGD